MTEDIIDKQMRASEAIVKMHSRLNLSLSHLREGKTLDIGRVNNLRKRLTTVDKILKEFEFLVKYYDEEVEDFLKSGPKGVDPLDNSSS